MFSHCINLDNVSVTETVKDELQVVQTTNTGSQFIFSHMYALTGAGSLVISVTA